jgi:3-hydroxyisobutyrate dehydrogenase-like beta-hydroxyacid dehydrogenase
MTNPVGFIGLGAMGLPIASRLLEAGHQLRIYNRTPEKAAALAARVRSWPIRRRQSSSRTDW